MRFKSRAKVQPELVASKDTSRPVLTKVHLNAEASCVEVTDSYMLARFPVELDEGDTSGPIPVDALKASRKPPLGSFLETSIRCNSNVEVRQGFGDEASEPYLTIPRESVDYQFPNVDRLMPENLAEFRIGLNAELLYRLAKALGCGKTDGIELRFTADGEGNPSPLRPIVVSPLKGDGEGNAPDGLIMPIRVR